MGRTVLVSVAVLLVAVQLAACLPYSKDSGILDLTPQNFQSLVVNSPKYTLVEFYAPWCGHCKNLAPEYEKAAKNLQGMVQLAAVNCDAESNRALASKYGIQGFPTLKLFKTGSDTPVEDYQGQRTAAGIVNYLTGKLSEKNIKKVTAANADDFFGKKDTASVVLFTEKPKRTNLFKALAHNFAGRLQFADIQDKETELVARYNVDKFPTLLVVTKEGEQVSYKGQLQYPEIGAFLQQYAEPAKAGANKGAKPEPPKPKADTEGLEVVTQKDLEVKCLSQRGLCALAFMPTEERDQYIAIVEQLAAERTNGAVVFMWLDGEKHAAFKNELGVSDNLPGLVLLSPHKKRAANFKGAFVPEPINDFVDKVLRGSKQTFALDSIPSLA